MHGEFTPNNISKKEKKERTTNQSSGCVQFMKGQSRPISLLRASVCRGRVSNEFAC